MMEVRERLLQLSQEKGCSLASLSERIGRNSTYLQQFIRRGSPRKLEERDRRILAEFFGVSEVELAPSDYFAEEISYDAARALPLSGGAGQASDFAALPRLSNAAENAGHENFRFSLRWLADQGLADASLFTMLVEGDSMEPLLRAGDEVLVDCSAMPFRDGIYVVRLGGRLQVKRVTAQGAARFALLSQNLSYPPLEVSAENLEIIGRVVWKSARV